MCSKGTTEVGWVGQHSWGPGGEAALSLGSKGEWDPGLEKEQGGRFGLSPSPPTSAPNTITH